MLYFANTLQRLKTRLLQYNSSQFFAVRRVLYRIANLGNMFRKNRDAFQSANRFTVEKRLTKIIFVF